MLDSAKQPRKIAAVEMDAFRRIVMPLKENPANIRLSYDEDKHRYNRICLVPTKELMRLPKEQCMIFERNKDGWVNQIGREGYK